MILYNTYIQVSNLKREHNCNGNISQRFFYTKWFGCFQLARLSSARLFTNRNKTTRQDPFFANSWIFKFPCNFAVYLLKVQHGYQWMILRMITVLLSECHLLKIRNLNFTISCWCAFCADSFRIAWAHRSCLAGVFWLTVRPFRGGKCHIHGLI